MKKIFILCLAALFAVSCTNSIVPSRNVITQTRNIGNFSAIVVESGLHVNVRMSGSSSLKITADDNILAYIETFTSGDKLYIIVQDGISFVRNPTIEIEVDAIYLNKAKASGGASIDITGAVICEDFELELSGGARLEGEIIAGELDADLSGGSMADVWGSAIEFDLDCSGGSRFIDFDFISDHADIDLSGGSSAKVTINNSLKINASGASKLQYKGNPVITEINTSGASEIQKVN